jgi:hypothetical protein
MKKWLMMTQLWTCWSSVLRWHFTCQDEWISVIGRSFGVNMPMSHLNMREKVLESVYLQQHQRDKFMDWSSLLNQQWQELSILMCCKVGSCHSCRKIFQVIFANEIGPNWTSIMNWGCTQWTSNQLSGYVEPMEWPPRWPELKLKHCFFWEFF